MSEINEVTNLEKINLLWRKFNNAANINQTSDFGGQPLAFNNSINVDNLLNKPIPQTISITQEDVDNTELSNYITQYGNNITIANLDNFFGPSGLNKEPGFSLDLSFLNFPLKYYYKQPLKSIMGKIYSFTATFPDVSESSAADAINSNLAQNILKNTVPWSKDLSLNTYQYILYYTNDPYISSSNLTSYTYVTMGMYENPSFWLLDNKTGILQFYGGTPSSTDVDIANITTYNDWTSGSSSNKSPPFFSYIRYVGDTGFNNVEMSGNIVVDGSLNINGNLTLAGDLNTNNMKIDQDGVYINNSLVLYRQDGFNYCTINGYRNLEHPYPTTDTGYINFSAYWGLTGMQYHQSDPSWSTVLKIRGTFQETAGTLISSDNRFKHNEVLITDALSVIRKMNPKKYQKTVVMYEEDYNGEVNDEWIYESGLISQEILKIDELKYCVSKTTGIVEQDKEPEEYYSLRYNDIFVYNLAATKELDQIVSMQATTIANLKQENIDLSNNVILLQQENATIKAALNELLTASGKSTI
jgi:hypothetical protein